MHERFGADVRVRHEETTDRQLFLVRGVSADVPLTGLIRSRGGKVVLQGSRWVLAELSLLEAQGLRRQSGVFSVGGVSVDPKRFALFRQALEASGNPE
jgi:hypothetical protein